ncbi:hypothetical protein [Streptomyces subrutilus]|uniref:DUF2264 C-terminal domain-containing protein n=1 Tax=Streptomyces subrutilus TaxID=36818 RepID=UPI002E14309A
MAGTAVTATWSPYPDVRVYTWLVPAGEWHVRIHRLTTGRPLHTAEAGFCVPAEPGGSPAREAAAGARATASAGNLVAAVRDLAGGRQGEVIRPDPNSHLMWPRTLLPTLRGTLDPGEHWLVTACFAGTEAGGEQRFAQGPAAAAVARAAELASLPGPVRARLAGARSAP